MRILALYNLKGGVGKTAGAVNLAYYSALAGRRTLVWDLDPQGAATFYFRIKPKIRGGTTKLLRKKNRQRLHEHIRGSDFDLLDVVPADFSYRHLDIELDAAKKPERLIAKLLAPLASEYDVVYLDCAPSISVTSAAIFAAADALLVPTVPTPLSIRALEQVDRHLADQGPPRLRSLPFLSMVDRRKKLHRLGDELARENRYEFVRTEPFLATPIPYSSLVEQMGVQRAPLPSFAYHTDAARAYLELWREVDARFPTGES